MSIVGRVALVVVGLIVAFAGMVAWSVEDEYGSGLNFSLSQSAGGSWVVRQIDEQNATSAIVFEGSQDDATAYTETQRSTGKSFVTPGLVIAAGALMFIAAMVWPLLRRFRRREGTVQ